MAINWNFHPASLMENISSGAWNCGTLHLLHPYHAEDSGGWVYGVRFLEHEKHGFSWL